jgi:hypothetical protein
LLEGVIMIFFLFDLGSGPEVWARSLNQEGLTKWQRNKLCSRTPKVQFHIITWLKRWVFSFNALWKFASITNTIFQLLGWFHLKAPILPSLVNSTLVFTSHIIYLMLFDVPVNCKSISTGRLQTPLFIKSWRRIAEIMLRSCIDVHFTVVILTPSKSFLYYGFGQWLLLVQM